MIKSRALTASIAAMSLLATSGAALAEGNRAAAASKLSVAASPAVAKLRASSLDRKNLNLFNEDGGLSTLAIVGGIVVIGLAVGCAASFCKSSSP